MSNEKNKCVLGMRHLSVADFIQEAQKRQTALSHPAFSSVVPQPAIVSGLIAQLIVANGHCISRNFTFLPQRNQLVKDIIGMIGLQCDGVNNLAQGNLDLLVLSSFPLKRAYGARPIPEVGRMLKIETGRETGEIILQAQANKEKTYYLFEVLQADGKVILHVSQKSRAMVPHIAQDMDISVRVCIGNARGMGAWSEYLKFITPRVASQPLQNAADSGSLKIA